MPVGDEHPTPVKSEPRVRDLKPKGFGIGPQDVTLHFPALLLPQAIGIIAK